MPLLHASLTCPSVLHSSRIRFGRSERPSGAVSTFTVATTSTYPHSVNAAGDSAFRVRRETEALDPDPPAPLSGVPTSSTWSSSRREEDHVAVGEAETPEEEEENTSRYSTAHDGTFRVSEWGQDVPEEDSMEGSGRRSRSCCRTHEKSTSEGPDAPFAPQREMKRRPIVEEGASRFLPFSSSRFGRCRETKESVMTPVNRKETPLDAHEFHTAEERDVKAALQEETPRPHAKEDKEGEEEKSTGWRRSLTLPEEKTERLDANTLLLSPCRNRTSTETLARVSCAPVVAMEIALPFLTSLTSLSFSSVGDPFVPNPSFVGQGLKLGSASKPLAKEVEEDNEEEETIENTDALYALLFYPFLSSHGVLPSFPLPEKERTAVLSYCLSAPSSFQIRSDAHDALPLAFPPLSRHAAVGFSNGDSIIAPPLPFRLDHCSSLAPVLSWLNASSFPPTGPSGSPCSFAVQRRGSASMFSKSRRRTFSKDEDGTEENELVEEGPVMRILCTTPQVVQGTTQPFSPSWCRMALCVPTPSLSSVAGPSWESSTQETPLPTEVTSEERKKNIGKTHRDQISSLSTSCVPPPPVLALPSSSAATNVDTAVGTPLPPTAEDPILSSSVGALECAISFLSEVVQRGIEMGGEVVEWKAETEKRSAPLRLPVKNAIVSIKREGLEAHVGMERQDHPKMGATGKEQGYRFGHHKVSEHEKVEGEGAAFPNASQEEEGGTTRRKDRRQERKRGLKRSRGGSILSRKGKLASLSVSCALCCSSSPLPFFSTPIHAISSSWCSTASCTAPLSVLSSSCPSMARIRLRFSLSSLLHEDDLGLPFDARERLRSVVQQSLLHRLFSCHAAWTAAERPPHGALASEEEAEEKARLFVDVKEPKKWEDGVELVVPPGVPLKLSWDTEGPYAPWKGGHEQDRHALRRRQTRCTSGPAFCFSFPTLPPPPDPPVPFWIAAFVHHSQIYSSVIAALRSHPLLQPYHSSAASSFCFTDDAQEFEEEDATCASGKEEGAGVGHGAWETLFHDTDASETSHFSRFLRKPPLPSQEGAGQKRRTGETDDDEETEELARAWSSLRLWWRASALQQWPSWVPSQQESLHIITSLHYTALTFMMEMIQFTEQHTASSCGPAFPASPTPSEPQGDITRVSPFPSSYVSDTEVPPLRCRCPPHPKGPKRNEEEEEAVRHSDSFSFPLPPSGASGRKPCAWPMLFSFLYFTDGVCRKEREDHLLSVFWQCIHQKTRGDEAMEGRAPRQGRRAWVSSPSASSLSSFGSSVASSFKVPFRTPPPNVARHTPSPSSISSAIPFSLPSCWSQMQRSHLQRYHDVADPSSFSPLLYRMLRFQLEEEEGKRLALQQAYTASRGKARDEKKETSAATRNPSSSSPPPPRSYTPPMHPTSSSSQGVCSFVLSCGIPPPSTSMRCPFPLSYPQEVEDLFAKDPSEAKPVRCSTPDEAQRQLHTIGPCIREPSPKQEERKPKEPTPPPPTHVAKQRRAVEKEIAALKAMQWRLKRIEEAVVYPFTPPRPSNASCQGGVVEEESNVFHSLTSFPSLLELIQYFALMWMQRLAPDIYQRIQERYGSSSAVMEQQWNARVQTTIPLHLPTSAMKQTRESAQEATWEGKKTPSPPPQCHRSEVETCTKVHVTHTACVPSGTSPGRGTRSSCNGHSFSSGGHSESWPSMVLRWTVRVAHWRWWWNPLFFPSSSSSFGTTRRSPPIEWQLPPHLPLSASIVHTISKLLVHFILHGTGGEKERPSLCFSPSTTGGGKKEGNTTVDVSCCSTETLACRPDPLLATEHQSNKAAILKGAEEAGNYLAVRVSHCLADDVPGEVLPSRAARWAALSRDVCFVLQWIPIISTYLLQEHEMKNLWETCLARMLSLATTTEKYDTVGAARSSSSVFGVDLAFGELTKREETAKEQQTDEEAAAMSARRRPTSPPEKSVASEARLREMEAAREACVRERGFRYVCGVLVWLATVRYTDPHSLVPFFPREEPTGAPGKEGGKAFHHTSAAPFTPTRPRNGVADGGTVGPLPVAKCCQGTTGNKGGPIGKSSMGRGGGTTPTASLFPAPSPLVLPPSVSVWKEYFWTLFSFHSMPPPPPPSSMAAVGTPERGRPSLGKKEPTAERPETTSSSPALRSALQGQPVWPTPHSMHPPPTNAGLPPWKFHGREEEEGSHPSFASPNGVPSIHEVTTMALATRDRWDTGKAEGGAPPPLPPLETAEAYFTWIWCVLHHVEVERRKEPKRKKRCTTTTRSEKETIFREEEGRQGWRRADQKGLRHRQKRVAPSSCASSCASSVSCRGEEGLRWRTHHGTSHRFSRQISRGSSSSRSSSYHTASVGVSSRVTGVPIRSPATISRCSLPSWKDDASSVGSTVRWHERNHQRRRTRKRLRSRFPSTSHTPPPLPPGGARPVCSPLRAPGVSSTTRHIERAGGKEEPPHGSPLFHALSSPPTATPRPTLAHTMEEDEDVVVLYDESTTTARKFPVSFMKDRSLDEVGLASIAMASTAAVVLPSGGRPCPSRAGESTTEGREGGTSPCREGGWATREGNQDTVEWRRKNSSAMQLEGVSSPKEEENEVDWEERPLPLHKHSLRHLRLLVLSLLTDVKQRTAPSFANPFPPLLDMHGHRPPSPLAGSSPVMRKEPETNPKVEQHGGAMLPVFPFSDTHEGSAIYKAMESTLLTPVYLTTKEMILEEEEEEKVKTRKKTPLATRCLFQEVIGTGVATLSHGNDGGHGTTTAPLLSSPSPSVDRARLRYWLEQTWLKNGKMETKSLAHQRRALHLCAIPGNEQRLVNGNGAEKENQEEMPDGGEPPEGVPSTHSAWERWGKTTAAERTSAFFTRPAVYGEDCWVREYVTNEEEEEEEACKREAELQEATQKRGIGRHAASQKGSDKASHRSGSTEKARASFSPSASWSSSFGMALSCISFTSSSSPFSSRGGGEASSFLFSSSFSSSWSFEGVPEDTEKNKYPYKKGRSTRRRREETENQHRRNRQHEKRNRCAHWKDHEQANKSPIGVLKDATKEASTSTCSSSFDSDHQKSRKMQGMNHQNSFLTPTHDEGSPSISDYSLPTPSEDTFLH